MEDDDEGRVACFACGKIIRRDIQGRWYVSAGPWLSSRGTWHSMDPAVNPRPWYCEANQSNGGEHLPDPERSGDYGVLR